MDKEGNAVGVVHIHPKLFDRIGGNEERLAKYGVMVDGSQNKERFGAPTIEEKYALVKAIIMRVEDRDFRENILNAMDVKDIYVAAKHALIKEKDHKARDIILAELAERAKIQATR